MYTTLQRMEGRGLVVSKAEHGHRFWLATAEGLRMLGLHEEATKAYSNVLTDVPPSPERLREAKADMTKIVTAEDDPVRELVDHEAKAMAKVLEAEKRQRLEKARAVLASRETKPTADGRYVLPQGPDPADARREAMQRKFLKQEAPKRSPLEPEDE